MSEGSNKESKSIGRNIFAERTGSKSPEPENKEKPKKAETSKKEVSKSIGRNIFSETPSKKSQRSVDSELNIIEKPSQETKKTSKSKSGVKAETVNAIHITKENVVFAQTVYDGYNYRLLNLQVVPIELPKITEENVFKEKEDPQIANFKLQCDAINKVFDRAGVSKNDENIVSSLNGNQVIIKQIYVQNIEDENIEEELPLLLKSPFSRLAKYEYVKLSSEGNNHYILGAVVDSNVFFETQKILTQCGVECSILDIDKMAIVNLYHESVKPPKGSISCIIDISYDYSNIIIVPNGNEELYIRNIEFNYNSFKKMLQNNRDISSEETEEMIRKRNFYDYITKAFESETTENLNQHYPVKKFVRMQLLRELQKTFQYYSTQNHNKIPSKIYITGKALEIHKFAEFINKNTDIPCSPLDTVGFFNGDVNVVDYAKDKQSIAYVALGLALRYE